MFSRSQVESLSRAILESQPNAIVHLCILRDVLGLPPGNHELKKSRMLMQSHPWLEELKKEQHDDGSWGRFHSMNLTFKARFPTTEIAVRRALGLDQNASVLAKAVGFMQSVLEGKAAWSDRTEKTEGWPVAAEAITAATLADIYPAHPAIMPAWEYWAGIASFSFPGGTYDPSVEWKAHKDRRGIGLCYLRSRYVISLLGSPSASLPASLDRQIVDWAWNNPAGIGYLGADMRHSEHFHIFQWLESLEILTRFQNWRKVVLGAVAWLWEHRTQNGWWGFGSKVNKSTYFPLSDDWRANGNRCVDHSTRVLACLSRYDPGL